MSQACVRPVPNLGLEVDLNTFGETRLPGERTLWTDEAHRDNIVFGPDSLLRPFFAKFVNRTQDKVLFEMRLGNGREVASSSVPISQTKGIPLSLQQQLLRAYEDFQSKADDPGATDEAKEYIRSMRLADPKESPEMYRLYDGNTKLLVLWGCERNGLKPLSPLDAIRRLPTFRQVGWLLRALAILMGVALLLLALWLLSLAFPNLSGFLGSGQNSSPNPAVAPLPTVTNTTEPPFLVVLPRVVVSGEPVELIPRTEGVLVLYGFDGKERLRRTAHGVNDREKLNIRSAGRRKVEFIPANKNFGTEKVDFIVYEQPLIEARKVTVALPPGLGDGFLIEWGDGDSGTFSPDSDGLVSHDYREDGSFLIKIIPPATQAWNAKEFPMLVRTPSELK